MWIRKGWELKIADVGPLAVCTKGGIKEIEIELDGVRMMISVRLCQVVNK